METLSCTRAWKALTLEVLVENSGHKNSWSNRPLWTSLEEAIHRLWVLPLPSSYPTTLMKWHVTLLMLRKSDRWLWPIDNTDRAWDSQVGVSNSHRPQLISQLMQMGCNRWYWVIMLRMTLYSTMSYLHKFTLHIAIRVPKTNKIIMWEWVESITIDLQCPETNQWVSHLLLWSKQGNKLICKTSSKLLTTLSCHNQ